MLLAEFWGAPRLNLTPRETVFHQVSKKILVAIGMRRAGKTCFLLQEIYRLLQQEICQEQILYLQLDDERILPIDGVQLGQMVDSFYRIYPQNHDRTCYLFFDEIQNVASWPQVIRRLQDTKNVRIYLSGSSAKLLSKEIATSLRGRSLATEIYPFGFREFLSFLSKPQPMRVRSPKQRDLLQQDLQRFLLWGGFPEIIGVANRDQQRRILQEYLNVTIYRDIVERHGVTNITLLKQLVSILIHNAGHAFTVNKCFNDLKSQGFKVAKETLYDYLDFANDCYLIFPVELFSESFRKRSVNPRKIYIIDTGMVCANTLWSKPPWGRLFENLVFLDLKRSGHKIHYYQTHDKSFEVDFVATSPGGKQLLYQVCWDMSDKTTREREERALQAASKELKLTGQIVTPQNYYEFVQTLGQFAHGPKMR